MAAGGGLVININYDSSVDSAPAAFKSGVTAAVQQLEGLFTNVSVTLTIDVGYGEVNGQALSPDNLGQSDTFLNLVVYDYSQVRAALVAEGAPGSSTLPATSPSPGAGIPATSFAQGKALGIGPIRTTPTAASMALSGSAASCHSATQTVSRHHRTNTISSAWSSTRLPRSWDDIRARRSPEP